MSFLFVIRGNDQGCRFEIRDTVVSIGREMNCLFQLHDPEASRRHAEIRKVRNVDTLFDLGSSNGSFVNGKRVKSIALHSGDQIQIGRTLILYSRAEKEEPKENIIVEIDSDSKSYEASSAIIASVPREEATWFLDGLSDDFANVPYSSWMKKARGHLKMMYHTTLVVSQTLDTNRLLHRMIDLIFDWVEIDRACVLFYDSEQEKLIPQVSRIRENAEPQPPLRISQTILDYVMQKEEGVLTSDARKDERWDPGASILCDSIREAICVPMQGRYGMVGVIYLDTADIGSVSEKKDSAESSSVRKRRLSRDHLKLMGVIAHQAALAVEDTRYYRGMVQAERLAAVGQTVAVLSHDIKNILQGISGGSFLIERGLADHDEKQIAQGWKIVQKNQSMISDLVMDMLTLSKEREPLLSLEDINQVVANAVELTRERCRELNIELVWTPDDSIPQFCFDANQISRAVTNIIINGIEAVQEKLSNETSDNVFPDSGTDAIATSPTPQPVVLKQSDPTLKSLTKPTQQGRIEIVTQLNEPFGRVEIIVDDSGKGFPLEQKEYLFQPFRTTKKGHGTGLGLAVTQKIIQEHNGNVRLAQSPLGGARLTLEIPLLISEGNASDPPQVGPTNQYSEI